MSNDPKADELKELEKLWASAVTKDFAPLAKTHTMKEFSFSVGERRQLVKIYTIQDLAQRTIQDILNNNALPRVGVIPNPNVKVTYDLTVGRFAVMTPRENKTKKVASPDKVL